MLKMNQWHLHETHVKALIMKDMCIRINVHIRVLIFLGYAQMCVNIKMNAISYILYACSDKLDRTEKWRTRRSSETGLHMKYELIGRSKIMRKE